MSKFLLVTDLDQTLVGDDRSMLKLNQRLSQHRTDWGTKLVYCTGRSLTSYTQLKAEKNLLDPDGLITSVGTEIYLNPADPQPNSTWSAQLQMGWDRDRVRATAAHFADLLPQPDSEQRLFKVSFFLTAIAASELLPRLKSRLTEQGLDCKLVYSSGKDLDILPQWADKGLAVQFLQRQWQFAPERTVVCGDSGNDIALFSVGDNYGIVVGNAQPELRQWYATYASSRCYLATGLCAAGMLEGLNYFGFLKD